MGYTHIGKVLDNGIVDTHQEVLYPDDLLVNPEDDGLHISDFRKGDFEWWYFDLSDRESGCFLKIVFHIGTNPLKTRIFPQLAISVTTPEGSTNLTQPYLLSEIQAETGRCQLIVKNQLDIRVDPGNPSHYTLKVNTSVFQCNLSFNSQIEGWKPLGNEVINRIGKREGAFSWIIPVPKGTVNGEFSIREKIYTIREAIGYHDHNYIRVHPRHPLHLDALISKWYWGKCYAKDITAIFMDTRCRNNPLLSLMVASEESIIYSANNMLDCSIDDTMKDSALGVDFPSKISIRSVGAGFSFHAELEYEKLLDSKDLLEGLPGPVKFLIKKWVARPAYHGIFTRTSIRAGDRVLSGWGNFESMVFRENR